MEECEEILGYKAENICHFFQNFWKELDKNLSVSRKAEFLVKNNAKDAIDRLVKPNVAATCFNGKIFNKKS